MDRFTCIEEILSSDFANYKDYSKAKPKTDRVLKSTKIEQAIYEDLSVDCEELSEYEKQGKSKLSTFDSLINDVFQSLYGIVPKYNDEENMSSLAKSFNKGILEKTMTNNSFAAVKSVCEGKELPAISATEEFVGKILGQLDDIMRKTTGGKGKIDALNEMEKSKKELLNQLSELLQKRETLPNAQKEVIERKIINKANNYLSKNEQIQMYSRIIENGLNRNSGSIKNVVDVALSAALKAAEETESAVLSWGNGDPKMQKNPLNTEVLKRCSKSDKLKYVARFLGRYKDMLNSKRLAGYVYGNGEKYDIEYGNKISKMLTSEISLLSMNDMIPFFLKKYQSKSLKQYRRREPEYKGKGDIIVCLDESDSTYGENNAYGMAIAMVLYQICRINKTNFAIVHFSSGVKTEVFLKDEHVSPQRIMDCAETFLSGGTNFDNPLREVNLLMSDGRFEKPDIVFITDGICNVSAELIEVFDKLKTDTGAKLNGILLDEGTCIDFSLKNFADKIYRTSELMKERIVDDIISERL